jgi:hypothetical protein
LPMEMPRTSLPKFSSPKPRYKSEISIENPG